MKELGVLTLVTWTIALVGVGVVVRQMEESGE